jgi:hypothetical protein
MSLRELDQVSRYIASNKVAASLRDPTFLNRVIDPPRAFSSVRITQHLTRPLSACRDNEHVTLGVAGGLIRFMALTLRFRRQ